MIRRTSPILTNFVREKTHQTQAAELNREQDLAVKEALTHPLSIITGGPGTGKTFTAAAIVKALNTKTILTAPTEKAISHLESKLDHPVISATLHALLKVRSPLDITTSPLKP